MENTDSASCKHTCWPQPSLHQTAPRHRCTYFTIPTVPLQRCFARWLRTCARSLLSCCHWPDVALRCHVMYAAMRIYICVCIFVETCAYIYVKLRPRLPPSNTKSHPSLSTGPSLFWVEFQTLLQSLFGECLAAVCLDMLSSLQGHNFNVLLLLVG